MRVLVTGASGFLGSHVAEQLVAEGHDVRCLVRRSSKVEHLEELTRTALKKGGGARLELVNGAIDDAASLPDAVRDVEAVIHCAGVVKARTWDDFLRVNAKGAVDLAEAAIAHAPDLRRFVHVSTAGVMGPSKKDEPHRPDGPTNPVTQYSKSKLAGEEALRKLTGQLPLTIIRPPAIYGPRDQEILAFFQSIRRTRTAFRLGTSMQSVSMVYGADAADACIRATTHHGDSGSTYFVEDGTVHSYQSMAEAIAAAYGFRLLAAPSVPKALVGLAARASEAFGKATDRTMMFNRDKLGELLIEHFTVDSTATRRDLGWSPKVTFREGAERTAKWYREHGWD
jgi:nucleoside-diphosphate-sugar epimerase